LIRPPAPCRQIGSGAGCEDARVGRRRRVALPVAAFVVEMNAPLAVLGYLFVGVTGWP